jgi:pectate lyase
MVRKVLFTGGLVSALSLGVLFQKGFGYQKTEQPEGWASQSGGTTGGAGGTEVAVSTMAQLQSEAKSSGKKILIVNKGTYVGEVVLASDKSILGKEPGVLIKGSIHVSKVNNVIIRNLAVKGDPCSTLDECKGGDDAMSINSEAHHVWLDHLDISDGQDGNCDITNGSDFVTVTWSKFWYSYDKEHRFSNLIASDDNVAIDKGRLNVTYAYCWWADRVVERQPRGRAGKVHVMNNLYTSSATSYLCGPGVDIQMLIENNAMKTSGTAIKPFDGSPAPAWKSVGNIGTAQGLASNQGSVFSPPYTMTLKWAADAVDAKVRPAAGNTLTLETGTAGSIAKPEQAEHAGKEGAAVRNSRKPFVSASPEGLRFHHPAPGPLGYELLDANGRLRE